MSRLFKQERTIEIMKITSVQKDLLASIAVGITAIVLFVLLMGTVVMWGQSTGGKVRSKLTGSQTQTTAPSNSTDGATSP